MEDILVPFFGMLFSMGAPAVIIWQLISSRHRERMTIIDRGLDPNVYAALYRRNKQSGNPLNMLRWALPLVFCGAGLWYGSWLVQVFNFPEATPFGFVLIGGGIGLIIYYFVASRKRADTTNPETN